MKIGVFGCGNMMSAVVKGIYIKNNKLDFYTYTPSQTRAKELAQAVEGSFVESLADFPECDIYFVGCKPQQVKALSESVNLENKIIVSILAGTSVSRLEHLFKTKQIIRLMPNTPCLVGEGITLYYQTSSIPVKLGHQIKSNLDSLGMLLALENESSLDELTTITGSGPALVYYFFQGLVEKATSLGLSREESNQILNQLLAGSSKLISSSEEKPNFIDQINKVTSKGGVTLAALEVLEQSKLHNSISDAIDSGIKRNEELSKF